ncbi:MAG TPA: mismatch repair protein [Granulicella sp.]|jgi:hypothetical protein
MDAVSVKELHQTPVEVYTHRMQALQELQLTERRRARALGYIKLVLACLIAIFALLLLRYFTLLIPLLAFVASFAVLAILHEKALRSLRYRARSINFFERGLARLNDRWHGTGETGDRFLDLEHPYARDLDLFGKSSLFELLCTARTRAGEETLARWLLTTASINEALARQAAVLDLKERVDFREKLSSLGQTIRIGVHPDALSNWGTSAPILTNRSIAVVAFVLTTLWLLSLIAAGLWHLGPIALGITILNTAYYRYLNRRLTQSASSIEAATADLGLLASVLQLFEEENFSSPKLFGLQNELKRKGLQPSAAVGRLRRIVDLLESRHNLMGRLLDCVTFWSVHLALSAERWQETFGPEIRSWLNTIGELEALAALSGFAYEHPDNVYPTFTPHGPIFAAVNFAHPLLPASRAIRNDLTLDTNLRLIVLSGPNMAGKSTLIRGIGLNVVLAHCGAPVPASSLTLSPLAIAASICVSDSLSSGISRFYAEIRRIKLISDLTDGPFPVLFLMDELLSGTNSHDRLKGTTFIVQSLLEKGAIGIISTHDLALTQIPESLGTLAANFHVEDRFEDGELIFDYRLKPGIVKASNALELMRSIGLQVPIDTSN